ncbi:hypothetical protein J4760_13010 [Salinicoccus sp. ID82-1]|uniref:hypothetical protein n=1 Tax=Salinicoccus sp. ID82-1 TaxID=2820269 RepID=UPI001F3098B7|nr:hypothetical protein [Salinicoccus sp. ID82-1]MCG1010940.1 hypothetical protein [Salinicoccus sp. ID82-1]
MNILYNEKILRNFFYIYAVLFILFLIYFFTNIEFLNPLVNYLAFAVLLLSWLFSSKLFKIIGFVFISTGIILSLSAGEGFGAVISNTMSNMPLLLFFSTLPWIGTVVRVGGLDDSITEMIQDRANKVENIYGRSIFTTYFFGIFLNISAIYIIQQLLGELFKRSEVAFKNEFIIKSTLRAFAMAVIWSPLEVIVGLTVDSTGVSYFTLLPWLFATSVIVGLTEVQITKRQFRGLTIDAPLYDIDNSAMIRSIVKMAILLLSFLSIVMVLNAYSTLGFIMTVALIIIPFSFAAAFVMKRFPIFLKAGWKAWKNHNNHMQNFSVLFLSLGVFSGGFNSSAAPGVMQQIFSYVDSFLILILLLIMLVIYGLAMFGVHPVATLAILAEVLVPVITPENALSIGIVMVVCGLGVSAAAPYGINATMTSQSMGINPYSITRINMSFSIRMAAIGIAMAMLALLI